MIDKNGREIRTGDVVQITGAYFKSDNGFWFVDYSPGDPNWCGGDHSLSKISKRGKISTAKYHLCSWPIMIFTNNMRKRAEGDAWNKEHAEIEVVENVPTGGILLYFEQKKQKAKKDGEREAYFYGADSKRAREYVEIVRHYDAVIEYIKRGA
ncbi:hypothetical protein [Selenomonas sp. AB3002]|uniref:hypothetical protein n=1 Tax=Selenomonas sp. AB3002 TaxID=1392502 RepID=UPI000497E929